MTESVERLTAGMTGRWLVRSRTSRHVWDLDARTNQRLPGTTSQSFPADGELIRYTRVGIWPEVGLRSVFFFDDPDWPEVMEQWRASSAIVSIERVES